MTRKVTKELIECCEEGVFSWETLARACLSYMSESDVANMAESDELLPPTEDEDDSEDEEGESEDEVQ